MASRQLSGMSLVAREFVNYDGPYGPNAIVINTDERRLNYIYRNVTDTHRGSIDSGAFGTGETGLYSVRFDVMKSWL